MRLGIVVAIVASTLSACATPNAPPPRSSFDDLRVQLLESKIDALTQKQAKNECLTRFSIANTTCTQLYMGEPSGPALLNKMAQCVRTRGFPQGSETCQ